MSVKNDIQFGIDWTKAAKQVGQDSIPLFSRHQYCALHKIGNGEFYHRKERIKMLFPSFQWHRWVDRRLKGICDYDWVTWLGPASSGKTTDAAAFALEYWLQAPDRTAVIVCSTTAAMLRMRIFAEIAKYHGTLPRNLGNVGELIDSKTMVRWQVGNDRNGIFGMAVEEGPTAQVVNNLIGIKAERVLLILDEMQGVREAIMEATSNLVSNPKFNFIGMGNPDSLTNPLGRESEPVGGWETVVAAETEEWETHGGPTPSNGLCQFFDGRKSPADDSEEERKRLFWLMNSDKRNGILKGCRGNENDPRYWQMGIGWPPPMGITSTVLDASIVQKFNCRKPPVWTHGFKWWASFDPAFEGGDKKVLTIGQCGETEHNGPKRWMIAITEQIEVPVNAKDNEPIDDQLVQWVKEYLTLKGIPGSRFAIDESGRGRSLLGVFRTQFGPVMGVDFGGAPSEKNVAGKNKTSKEEYDRRSSELNLSVRAFAESDGLRGLPELAEKQFCARRTYYKNKKYCVEPKTVRTGTGEKGYKQRMGHSPDHADSVAIGVSLCMDLFGAQPCMDDQIREATVEADEWFDQTKKQADEFNTDNYLYSHEPTIY